MVSCRERDGEPSRPTKIARKASWCVGWNERIAPSKSPALNWYMTMVGVDPIMTWFVRQNLGTSHLGASPAFWRMASAALRSAPHGTPRTDAGSSQARAGVAQPTARDEAWRRNLLLRKVIE